MLRRQRTSHYCSRRHLSSPTYVVITDMCCSTGQPFLDLHKPHPYPLSNRRQMRKGVAMLSALPSIYIGPSHGIVNIQHPPLLQGHAPFVIRQCRCVRGSKPPNPSLTMSHPSPTTATLLIVLQFTARTPCADAVHDLTACGARVREQQNVARNTTYTTEPSPVLRISYEECLVDRGAGMKNVSWQGFLRNFGM